MIDSFKPPTELEQQRVGTAIRMLILAVVLGFVVLWSKFNTGTPWPVERPAPDPFAPGKLILVNIDSAGCMYYTGIRGDDHRIKVCPPTKEQP